MMGRLKEGVGHKARVFPITDFNGIFGGFLCLVMAMLASRYGARYVPFDPLYLSGALALYGLFLLTRGRKIVMDGSNIHRVDYALKFIPVGRKTYPSGSFDAISVRSHGTENGQIHFVELVGPNILALGQFNNLTAAHALANELSLESGLPNS